MTTTTMMMQQTEGIETSHAKLTQIAWLMVVTITDPLTREDDRISHEHLTTHCQEHAEGQGDTASAVARTRPLHGQLAEREASREVGGEG